MPSAKGDLPVLQAGVILVGIIYMITTLLGRPDHRLDEPAGPTRPGEDVSTTRAAMGGDPELTPGMDPVADARQSAAQASQQAARAERRQARKERWRLLRRRPGFVIGCLIVLFWIVCAIGGSHITPYDPINDLVRTRCCRPAVGTGSAPTTWVGTCSRG